jgi:CTP synthase (UTP-ammonia lyase)
MSKRAKIGIIGDFTPELRTHAATNNAIKHSAEHLSMSVEVVWLPTESLLDSNDETVLRECDGLWASPSSPYRSKEGALKAIRFAREQDRPFVGT